MTTNLPSAHPWGWGFRWLLPAYLGEVHHNYPTAYGGVVNYLRKNARQDDLVFAWPEYTNYPILFYLGDRVKLCCLLDRDTRLLAEKVEAMERAGAPLLIDRHYPDWLVFFGANTDGASLLTKFSRPHTSGGQRVQIRYDLVAGLDVFWYATHRPELHLHSFGPKTTFDRDREAVYIFEGTAVPSPSSPSLTAPGR